jgi:hypothetical protein
MLWKRAILGLLLMGLGCAQAMAVEDEIQKRFSEEVAPLLQTYCHDCHSGPEAEAKFDATLFADSQRIVQYWDSWDGAVRRIVQREMPPADATTKPTEQQLATIQKWSEDLKALEAQKRRGDPGLITVRRLSNAEWNNTIRDLTGVDIQPARDFPVDPANAAGFDNSAESLTTSPALVSKYLAATRLIAEHLLLTPDGIRFAPFPVITDTDRDRYCVQRIVDFYSKQPLDISKYLYAAWQWQTAHKNQRLSDEYQASLSEVAQLHALSPKYLTLIVKTLSDEQIVYGPLKEVRDRWSAWLTGEQSEDEVRTGCKELASYIAQQREKLSPEFDYLKPPSGINGGSQPLVLWKNRQLANHRRTCRVDGFTDNENSSVLSESLRKEYSALTDQQKEKLQSDYQAFCSLFPDSFYVAERGRSHIDAKEAAREGKGRLLSAGFHSMMGYFRDDQPLYELVLDSEQQKEIDQLWIELDFITLAPFRQYSGHLWFERAEASFINDERFNFVRAEDKSASSSEVIKKFAEIYLTKLHERQADPKVVEAVQYYFSDMDQKLRLLEKQLSDSQERQLESLLSLLEPMYRQPIPSDLKANWKRFYERSRVLPTATHRTAIEDTLVAMLLSPKHLYRWDLQTTGSAITPLSADELANRWSYFLWASAPDGKLRHSASAGELQEQSGISSSLKRMVADPRFEGMVKEFLGNWLDFRRFETHNGVDRNQFAEFDDALRAAMFEEPIQYFVELVRRDGKLLELIDSNHTVVNHNLAQYYGLKEFSPSDSTAWQRVDEVSSLQRGGLASMGIFLTQNSPGLRTSPVKRGYWVVRKLLGEKIPAPPPNVPDLPNSEHDLGELTLREVLAKHREHPSCAGCHARFDSYGLLLEGFDPIGKPRSRDLGGREISASATLPDGSEAEGIVGLKRYLGQKRADDFRRHFCESLLAYALGRSLILSDSLLVDEMLETLKKNDDRILTTFEVILASPQFQRKRGTQTESTEVKDVSR